MHNEKKNSFWINVRLFSSPYLKNQIIKLPDFPHSSDSLVQKLWQELRTFWKKHQELLQAENIRESDTEDKFINPILDALKLPNLTKISLQGIRRQHYPDYTLFSSYEESIGALKAEPEARFKNAIGLLEAKYFGRQLDDPQYRPRQDDRSEKGLPAAQLVEYLRESDVDWGILTNGEVWRLYYRKGWQPLGHYFEIHLVDLISHPAITEEFCLFIYLFGMEAFKKEKDGKCRLDRLFELGERHAQEIGPDFFAGCCQALKTIFEFYQERKKAIKNFDVSRRCHQAALIALFRLIAIRYLEDRGVLPTLSDEYRRKLSLYYMRLEIEDHIKSGQTYSDSSIDLWQRLTKLFKDVNSGKFGIYPSHRGLESGLFDFDFDLFFQKIPLPDSLTSQVVDWVCRGGGREKSQIDFFDLGIEKIGDAYNELLSQRLVQDENGDVKLAISQSIKKELGSYFTPPILAKPMCEAIVEFLKENISEDKWLYG